MHGQISKILAQSMLYISDDHYQFSAFPFLLSASAFRFRFPFVRPPRFTLVSYHTLATYSLLYTYTMEQWAQVFQLHLTLLQVAIISEGTTACKGISLLLLLLLLSIKNFFSFFLAIL